MKITRFFLILIITLAVTLQFSACDTTAKRELDRAEKALDAALELSADAHATEDYTTADEMLQEAQELNADNKIQEARNMAIKAKLRAEDARRKAAERMRILDEEAERLGR